MEPEELIKFAIELSKSRPVLFWGSSTQYSKCPSWNGVDLCVVAEKLNEDSAKFLRELETAENGFYFFEADGERDLEYMRAWDFRNKTQNGLTLLLATPFKSEVHYVQAKGRVGREKDEGAVYALPRQMWLD